MRTHHGWWVTTSATACRSRLLSHLSLLNLFEKCFGIHNTLERNYMWTILYVSSDHYITSIFFTSATLKYSTPLLNMAQVPGSHAHTRGSLLPSFLPRASTVSVHNPQMTLKILLTHSCKNHKRSPFPILAWKLKQHIYQGRMFLLMVIRSWPWSVDNLTPRWMKIKAEIMRNKQKGIKTHLPWWQTFLLYFQKLYFWVFFIYNKFWGTIGKKAGSI